MAGDHAANGNPAGMRVMFVLPRMVAGGVERVTLNLIAGLQYEGVDCCLALGRCRGELFDEARRLVTVLEVAPYGPLSFVVGLCRAIRHYRPTHLVTAFADVSLMTLVARRFARSRAPVVVGMHGTLRPEAARGGRRAWWRHRLNRATWPPVLRCAGAVVAVSEGVASDLRHRYPAVAGKLVVIDNPALAGPAPKACTTPARGQPGPVRVVALGRLAPEKGFDVLLRAMPIIRASVDAELEIHGEGAERNRLQGMIDALGLDEHVRLMGATGQPLTVLTTADLFVFPSRNEGFGVALVEALACGCQIVASDCPHGPAEILRHGALGQLVPPEDPAALAAAVVRGLSGAVTFPADVLRRRAGDFTAARAVDRYRALFRRLTGDAKHANEKRQA